MYRISQDGVETFRNSGLTRREIEVLDYMLRFETEAEIAAQLFIETKTIKFHKTNIYRKLGIKRLSGAMMKLFPFVELVPKPVDIDALPVGVQAD